jgi:hypothetical protein
VFSSQYLRPLCQTTLMFTKLLDSRCRCIKIIPLLCETGGDKNNSIQPDDAYYNGSEKHCPRASPEKDDEKGMHSDCLIHT